MVIIRWKRDLVIYDAYQMKERFSNIWWLSDEREIQSFMMIIRWKRDFVIYGDYQMKESSLRDLDDKMKWLKNFERLLEIQVEDFHFHIYQFEVKVKSIQLIFHIRRHLVTITSLLLL